MSIRQRRLRAPISYAGYRVMFYPQFQNMNMDLFLMNHISEKDLLARINRDARSHEIIDSAQSLPDYPSLSEALRRTVDSEAYVIISGEDVLKYNLPDTTTRIFFGTNRS